MRNLSCPFTGEIMSHRALSFALLFSVLVASGAGGWGVSRTHAVELISLSLEELINMEVTSVGKKETKLLRSPAAIAVLTQEDLQRIGATSIPEALRAVPGMQVARISFRQRP